MSKIPKHKDVKQSRHITPEAHRSARTIVGSAVLVGALLLAGCGSGESQAEKDHRPQQTGAVYGPPSRPEASASAIPEDLKQLIATAAKTDADLSEVLKHPYKQAVQTSVGSKTLRISEIGSVTNGYDYEKLKNSYQLFSNFAASGAKFSVPVAEGDSNGNVVRTTRIEGHVAPLDKNIEVFVVPTSINIGTGPTGGPDTFTDPSLPNAMSIIRTGGIAQAGAFVESCQATTQFVIDNSEEFPEAQLSKIQLLAQEEMCNSLGEAVYLHQTGLTYAEYAAQKSKPLVGGTNAATPTQTAYYSSMPYLSQVDYEQIPHGIAVDVSDKLVFPQFTQ